MVLGGGFDMGRRREDAMIMDTITMMALGRGDRRGLPGFDLRLKKSRGDGYDG